MMLRMAMLGGLVCILLAALLGGTAPFARVLMMGGLPGAAASLFGTPDWQGVAAFRQGRAGAAADAFRRQGPSGFYNLGNALAADHKFAAALEAYDAALARNPEDQAAKTNFKLVAEYYAGTALDPTSLMDASKKRDGPTVAAEVAQGAARAASTGDGVTNQTALPGLPELESRARLAVRKVFDDRFIEASDRWLVTLKDVPAEFLAARIKAEHKRRIEAGTALPEASEPW